jgi:hypothetical protein
MRDDWDFFGEFFKNMNLIFFLYFGKLFKILYQKIESKTHDNDFTQYCKKNPRVVVV